MTIRKIEKGTWWLKVQLNGATYLRRYVARRMAEGAARATVANELRTLTRVLEGMGTP